MHKTGDGVKMYIWKVWESFVKFDRFEWGLPQPKSGTNPYLIPTQMLQQISGEIQNNQFSFLSCRNVINDKYQAWGIILIFGMQFSVEFSVSRPVMWIWILAPHRSRLNMTIICLSIICVISVYHQLHRLQLHQHIINNSTLFNLSHWCQFTHSGVKCQNAVK